MLHFVKKFVLVLLLLVGTVNGEYEFNHSISSLPGYLIEWTITGDEIELRLTAPTTGWVGFGISESGGMIGGDEFVAHVDDTTGAVVSNDYHSTVQDFSTPPVLDTCNDWVVVSGMQTTQKTIITVKRKLDTNDTYVLYTHVFSRSFVHTHTLTQTRLANSERIDGNSCHGSVRIVRYIFVSRFFSTSNDQDRFL